MSQFKYYPRDINLEDGERHKKFVELTEEPSSPFYKKTIKQVFMFALGIGLRNGKRLPLKKKTGIIPVRSLDDDLIVLKAVGIAEMKTVDVMFGENISNVFKIAEEYANAGIDSLYYQVFNPEPGDIDKRIEQPLRDIIKNMAIPKTT